MNRINIYISVAITVLIVMSFVGCDKGDVIAQQKDKIFTYLNGGNLSFDELSDGVFRVMTEPEDGAGTVTIERGDSLYLFFEIYRFSSGITKNSNNIIYTNRAASLPQGMIWDTEPKKIIAGSGSILKGVDESLIGSVLTDSVTVILTSENAYGDKYLQQLPPDSPIAWCVKVTNVIKPTN